MPVTFSSKFTNSNPFSRLSENYTDFLLKIVPKAIIAKMKHVTPSLEIAKKAIDSNPYAYLAHFAEAPQVQHYQEESLSWISTEGKLGLFNSVFGIRLNSRNVQANVSLVLSHFSRRKRPSVWWLGPSALPTELHRHLEERGGNHVDTVSLMACEIEKVTNLPMEGAGLRIEFVNDFNLLKAWTNVYGHARGLTGSEEETWFSILNNLDLSERSPLKHFVGYRKNLPVVCASLFLGGGLAGIYNVTTMPGYRKQGFAGAITKEAFRMAQESGYKIAMLGAEPEAIALYGKMGFKQYGQMKVFAC